MSSVSTSPGEVGEQAAASVKRRRAGMTLLEVMVATFVLFIIAAGILDVLMSAYRLTLVTRHSDNARAILVAFGDQFTRSNAVDLTNPSQLLSNSMWQPTGTTTNQYGTGAGLTWEGINGDANGLKVTLGATDSSAISATIFRKVSYVQTAYPFTTGNGASTASASDMLSATFTIVFNVNGEQKTETLSVARLWKNANAPTS